MQFKLENFKPIHSAEIKVNDLTLIFGDNNTGNYVKGMASNVFSSQSKQDNIIVNLSEIDFVKNKEIKLLGEKQQQHLVLLDSDQTIEYFQLEEVVKPCNTTIKNLKSL